VAFPALVAWLLGPACSHAQQNSAQRVHAFATLPNWTGLWETDAAAALLSGEAARAADRLSPTEAQAELGRRVPLLGGSAPYNPEWQKRSEDAIKRAKGAPPAPSKHCGGYGFPAVMDSPIPDDTFEALVTPEETLILFPHGQARHIYTDGRGHPRPDDLWPTEMGDSIGHWEGHTLIVDTVARKPGPIAPPPNPNTAVLSEKAHFTERIRRLDADTLENRMTIDDPLHFSHPWVVTIVYKRVADLDRMIEWNCTENDRDPIVNGRFVVAPSDAATTTPKDGKRSGPTN